MASAGQFSAPPPKPGKSILGTRLPIQREKPWEAKNLMATQNFHEIVFPLLLEEKAIFPPPSVFWGKSNGDEVEFSFNRWFLFSSSRAFIHFYFGWYNLSSLLVRVTPATQWQQGQKRYRIEGLRSLKTIRPYPKSRGETTTARDSNSALPYRAAFI